MTRPARKRCNAALEAAAHMNPYVGAPLNVRTVRHPA